MTHTKGCWIPGFLVRRRGPSLSQCQKTWPMTRLFGNYMKGRSFMGEKPSLKGEKKSKATAAGKSARAGRLLRARLLLLLQASLPFAKSSPRGGRRRQHSGLRGDPEASGRGPPGSPASQPPLGGGKTASRAHRPAPSAPLPAAGTLLRLLGSAWREPNA